MYYLLLDHENKSFSIPSHDRVLEAITEEAEKRDGERFQPLIDGMQSNNIALKVCSLFYN